MASGARSPACNLGCRRSGAQRERKAEEKARARGVGASVLSPCDVCVSELFEYSGSTQQPQLPVFGTDLVSVWPLFLASVGHSRTLQPNFLHSASWGRRAFWAFSGRLPPKKVLHLYRRMWKA